MPDQCERISRQLAGYETGFDSDGEKCRAVHFPPAHAQLATTSGKPCVVLAHGFGGTADSGLLPYARYFAEAGVHALVFDYRHFGNSDGMPRQLLSIHQQLGDWHAAIRHARSLEDVDPERIILWGVSLSGGHVIHVAANDRRVCAVIAQFPMMDGLAALLNIRRYAGLKRIFKLLGAGLRDLASGIFGRQPYMLPIVGKPGELVALSTPDAEAGYRAITPADWNNSVCGRIALSIPFYRPGFLLEKVRAPVFIQIADGDTILPYTSQERFIDTSDSSIRVGHYPLGHFDAFLGDGFGACVRDQMEFILKALRRSGYEKKQTQ